MSSVVVFSFRDDPGEENGYWRRVRSIRRGLEPAWRVARVEVDPTRGSGWHVAPTLWRVARRALRGWRSIRGADLVVAEGFMFLPAVVVARALGRPVAFDAHCFQERERPGAPEGAGRPLVHRFAIHLMNLACVRLASMTLCVSREEASYAVRRLGADPARVSVVPLSAARAGPGPTRGRARGRSSSGSEALRALFVGDLSAPHNRDAAEWILRAARGGAIPPTVTCVIAGPRPPSLAVGSAANVRVTGYVRDLGPLYEWADLLIAPLRFGSGVKTKVIDALAQGLPVLATPVAAEGIELAAGWETGLLVVDLRDFAGALAELVHRKSDLRAVRGAARQWMAERHGDAAVASALERSLRVGPPVGAPGTGG